MKSFSSILSAALVVGSVSHAATTQVPYSGGKLSDSVQIRTLSYHEYLGTRSTLGSVTFVLGDIVSIRFRTEQGQPPAGLCSHTPEEFGRILLQLETGGEAHQLRDSGTNWDLYPARPSESDLVGFQNETLVGDSIKRGEYHFASIGVCEGEYQQATGNWNRLIFVRKGIRYAKLSITAKQDTAWGVLPSYGYLKTITVRYVVNETNELSDPVSIRPTKALRLSDASRDWRAMDLFNPLGVKIRQPGRFEAVVPLRR